MARNTLQDAGETFPSIKAPKDQGSNPGAWCLGRDEKEYLIKLLFGDDCREVINEIIANRFHSSGLTGNLLVPTLDFVEFKSNGKGRRLYQSIMERYYGDIAPLIETEQFTDGSHLGVSSKKIECSMIGEAFREALDKGTLPETIEYEGSSYGVSELGKIAAMARLLGDHDWLGGGGGNLGFIPPTADHPSIRLVVIDSGESFKVQDEETLKSKDFKFGANHPDKIQFDKLPEDIKKEFLITLARLYFLSPEQLKKKLTGDGELIPVINKILEKSSRADLRELASSYLDDRVDQISDNLKKLFMTYEQDIKAIPEIWEALKLHFSQAEPETLLKGSEEVYKKMLGPEPVRMTLDEFVAPPPTAPNMMIHYIWMGHLDSDIKKKCCALGPSSLASLEPETSITMWVPEYLMEDAGKLFLNYPNIEIRSVDRMLAGEYGELREISKDNLIKIQTTMADMQATQSYVAQKDLMSMVILAEYGGYYFDCTSQFTAAPHLKAVDDFKVTIPKNLLKPDAEFILHPFCSTDVWAFAASGPGHPFFSSAFTKTLNFCAENTWERKWTAKTAGDFQDALVELYPQDSLTHEWLLAHSWESTRTESGHGVSELKLEKFNTGLWRRPENVLPTPTANALHTKAFLKLGLFSPKEEAGGEAAPSKIPGNKK